jgi:hypothetical protein
MWCCNAASSAVLMNPAFTLSLSSLVFYTFGRQTPQGLPCTPAPCPHHPTQDDNRAGERVAVDIGKRSPSDFALCNTHCAGC